MRVGFLGLGTMGAAMADRLLGFAELVPWNRSTAPLEALANKGIAVAATPAEALASEISFSMLANDEVTDEVLAISNIKPGTVHVCMASISPQLAKKLSLRFEKLGAVFVSAPVVGRPNVAAEGNLNILAAGERSALELAQPYFDLMGKKTWILGDDPSSANLVKIAVNYNILHTIQSLAESIAIVEQQGINANEFIDVLKGTLFGGVAHSGYGDQIANSRYEPTLFSLELGRKDLHLAMQAAKEAGVSLPTAQILDNLLGEALSDPELSSKDWAVLAEVTRKASRPSKD